MVDINKYIVFYESKLAKDNKTLFIKSVKYGISKEDSNFYYLRINANEFEKVSKEEKGVSYVVGEIKKYYIKGEK